jgi:hypothetical protein
VLNNLGTEHQRAGRPHDAGRCYEATVEVCRGLLRRWPDYPDGPVPLARGYQNLADVAAARGTPEGYERWTRAGIEVLEDHLPRRPRHNPGLYVQRQRRDEAAAIYPRAAAAWPAALTAEPGSANNRRGLTACYADWAAWFWGPTARRWGGW